MATKSHFTISQPYQLKDETPQEGRARRRAGFDKLKAAGYSDRYFVFIDGDEKAKQEAKAACTAMAEKAAADTGVKVYAAEGCFL